MDERFIITMDTKAYAKNTDGPDDIFAQVANLDGMSRIETSFKNLVGCIVYIAYSHELRLIRQSMQSHNNKNVREQNKCLAGWDKENSKHPQSIIALPVPSINVIDVFSMLEPLKDSDSYDLPIGLLYGTHNGLLAKRYAGTFVKIVRIK